MGIVGQQIALGGLGVHLRERERSAARTRIWLRSTLIGLGLLLAAAIPYLPFLSLPLISDGYLQVVLGRQYGRPEFWGDLASDVLYRTRATSILLTAIVDYLWGAEAWAHRLLNVLVHAGNVLLVALLGSWGRIGWRVSVPAAVVFALIQNHQEAVVWCASLPELLVFGFAVIALLGWVRWLQGRGSIWCAVFAAGFALALLSKESAVVVVPAAGLIWFVEGRRTRASVVVLAVAAASAAFYSYLIFAASATHLHLNDGTFSIRAPFYETMTVSVWRLLMPWGLISLVVLWATGVRRHLGRLHAAAIWMMLSLLPYAFLSYMNRVPSRHTYLATLGLAILIVPGWIALRGMKRGPVLAASVATAFVIINVTYLWTKKLDQYRQRAEPTERFLKFAAEDRTPVRIVCGPYGEEVYRSAARVRLGMGPEFVAGRVAVEEGSQWREYCDTARP
ncbi:MAG: hypothetical protein HY820_07220 [Acidobacteria bacterium]|nr:hypothetical protein [Acidobacteriota bacterium]